MRLSQRVATTSRYKVMHSDSSQTQHCAQMLTIARL